MPLRLIRRFRTTVYIIKYFRRDVEAHYFPSKGILFSKGVEIVEVSLEDYGKPVKFHYRSSYLATSKKILQLKDVEKQ